MAVLSIREVNGWVCVFVFGTCVHIGAPISAKGGAYASAIKGRSGHLQYVYSMQVQIPVSAVFLLFHYYIHA